MRLKNNPKLIVLLLLVCLVLFSISQALFTYFAVLIVLITAILTGVLAAYSILLRHVNYTTNFQLSAMFTSVIIFSSVIARISSSTPLLHPDFFMIHMRFLSVFTILTGTLIGLSFGRKKIGLYLTAFIGLATCSTMIYIILMSTKLASLTDTVARSSFVTLAINLAVLIAIYALLSRSHADEYKLKLPIFIFSTFLYLSDFLFYFGGVLPYQVFLSLFLGVIAFLILGTTSIYTNLHIPLKNIRAQKDSFIDMFKIATDPLLLFSWNDGKWIIDFVNESLSKQFGYSVDEMTNMPLEDLFFDKSQLYGLNVTIPSLLETDMVNKDRSVFVSELSFHSFEMLGIEEHLILLRDITEMKKQKHQLSIFELIFKNSYEAMFITNHDEVIQWANKSCANLYGYAPDEMVGLPTRALGSGLHDKPFFEEMWKTLSASGGWSGEIWNKTKKGELIPVHQSIIHIPGNDPLYAYASISVDLTESKLLDQKIYELAYIDHDLSIKNKNSLYESETDFNDKNLMLIQVYNYRNLSLRFGVDIALELLSCVLAAISTLHASFEVYRYDEDTFAIVYLTELSREAKPFSEDLYNHINISYSVNDIKILPIFHVGVSLYNRNEDYDLNRALFEAESALRKANTNTFSNLVFFNTNIEKDIITSYDFRNAVIQAVEDNDIQVYFQPIIDMFTGDLYGFEALARWELDGKYVSPTDFIAEAEKSNHIYKLGLQVLEYSCKQVKIWQQIMPHLRINVNVSLMQLENGMFVESIKEILKRIDFSPTDLTLEITESLSSISSLSIDKTIMELHEFGIQFALDDFGNGFSSIQRIKRMPITIAKIDHEFTQNIHLSLDDTSVLTGMISMSHKIGLDVIAEGVENEDQLQILKNRNCRYVQGYYFSRPLKPEKVSAYISAYDPEKISSRIRTERLEEVDTILENKNITSAIVGAAILDLDGLIVSGNRNFSSIMGEQKPTLIGQNINKFIKSNSDDFIIGNYLAENLVERSGIVQRSDGTMRYVIFSLYSDFDKFTSRSYIRCLVEDITENIDDELKLLRIRQGYEKIFQNAPVMIITLNKDYRVLEWNKTSEEILGHGAFNAKNRSIFDLFVPEEESVKWRKFVDTALGGMVIKDTLKTIDAQGNIHICECSNDVVLSTSGEVDFVIMIMKDITEKSLAQARSNSLLSIIDNGPALVLTCKANGEIWYRSKACLQTKPFDLISNVDELSFKFYDPHENEIQPPVRGAVQFWSSTGSLELGEDDQRHMRVTIFKDETSEMQEQLFVYIFMDFTKEYEQIQSIKHLKNILVDQERLAELGHLSAGIAHEINNPLSYMISSSDVLKEELESLYKVVTPTDKDNYEFLQKDILEIVEEFDEGLERIKTIVTGLRTYSWSGQKDEYTPFDLNQTINKVLTIAHNEIKYTANVSLTLGDLPSIDAIGSKIGQVILNLLINAAHAIKKKNLKEMGRISVRTYSDNTYVYCEIEDNGVGMNEAVVEKIFDAFYTTKPEGVGTGLGLSISKEIVQDIHNGYLKVDSTPDVGTKFTIQLPLHQPDEKLA